MTPEEERAIIEYQKCGRSPHYFIDEYCMIDDPNQPGSDWFPFRLWPAQFDTLDTVLESTKIITLKARQLGITWLLIGYALWLMIFRPGSMIMLFSRTGDDAKELIRRLRGMHDRLPEFLQASYDKQLEKELYFTELKSRAKSFATTKHSGRSFTATFVLVDEAAFIEFLRQLLNAAEETVDAGGQMAVISTADKDRPNNTFHQRFKDALNGKNDYTPIFLPWSARPTRSQAWYDHKKASKDQDDLYQEYPETPAQALAGRASNKRFKAAWLELCRDEQPDLGIGPAIPGLIVYERPFLPTHEYLLAVDTCEGDPTSDPSPITVFDATTFREVAHVYGRFEPSALAGYAVQLAQWYGGENCVICPERNNHGHAFNLATRQLLTQIDRKEKRPFLYVNPFDGKDGWLSSSTYKTLAVNQAADYFKDGALKLRTEASIIELGDIEASTLKAPEGATDDRAMSVIIGLAAIRWPMEKQAAGGFAVRR